MYNTARAQSPELRTYKSTKSIAYTRFTLCAFLISGYRYYLLCIAWHWKFFLFVILENKMITRKKSNTNLFRIWLSNLAPADSWPVKLGIPIGISQINRFEYILWWFMIRNLWVKFRNQSHSISISLNQRIKSNFSPNIIFIFNRNFRLSNIINCND